jgi:hypothetical protein
MARMIGSMPFAQHQPVEPHYNMAHFLELRRQMLRFSRSMPPGPERNNHRQVELSLRALFRNEDWIAAHVVKD